MSEDILQWGQSLVVQGCYSREEIIDKLLKVGTFLCGLTRNQYISSMGKVINDILSRGTDTIITHQHDDLSRHIIIHKEDNGLVIFMLSGINWDNVSIDNNFLIIDIAPIIGAQLSDMRINIISPVYRYIKLTAIDGFKDSVKHELVKRRSYICHNIELLDDTLRKIYTNIVMSGGLTDYEFVIVLPKENAHIIFSKSASTDMMFYTIFILEDDSEVNKVNLYQHFIRSVREVPGFKKLLTSERSVS